jgi:hypothetical protein
MIRVLLLPSIYFVWRSAISHSMSHSIIFIMVMYLLVVVTSRRLGAGLLPFLVGTVTRKFASHKFMLIYV